MAKISKTGIWLNVGLCLVGRASAQPYIVGQPFAPQPATVTPFGYGPVIQTLTTNAGLSGNAQCSARHMICQAVSNGYSCSLSVPAGAILSCGFKSNVVNETRFEPVPCNGQLMGDGGVSGLISNSDFCLADDYMPERTLDTFYLYNDYVRVGVSKQFGGMIAELYGVDKLDRLMQNTGGAMQLSLWAYTSTYAPANLARAYFAVSSTATTSWTSNWDPTPFDTAALCQNAHRGEQCVLGVLGPNYFGAGSVFPCADNGAAAGTPFNPLQGASLLCNSQAPGDPVDTVTQSAPGVLTVSKNGPANFTRSDAFTELSWSQTTSVPGPYVQVTYTINDPSNIDANDFQEIPALYTHAGIGNYIYYYEGTSPYADVDGPVTIYSTSAGEVLSLKLPNRAGPFGVGQQAFLTEDWVSACDATQTECLTIATFSSLSQDIIVAPNGTGSYVGVHGFFALRDSLKRTVTTFVFPYRFDQVVAGRSVRSWIYLLSKSPLYREANQPVAVLSDLKVLQDIIKKGRVNVRVHLR